jgi:acyl-CoA oxidase
VLDPDWYTAMLDWREKHVLETLARRLRRAADSDDPFAVFNSAQDHLLLAARAHIDAVLLHAFRDAVMTCEDESTAAVLGTLCDLYALSTLEAERAWFHEHGRLTAARSKAIVHEVNELCGRIRPIALDLVAAFAIPEPIIAARILTD